MLHPFGFTLTTQTVAFSNGAHQPQTCKLLSLPAELRNHIYCLAFAREADNDAELDLFTATGPSSSLLQTCRQIYSEASQIFIHPRDHFWTTTKFVLLLSRVDFNILSLKLYSQNNRSLNKIRHLTISGLRAIYHFEDGLWNGFDVASPTHGVPSQECFIFSDKDQIRFVDSTSQAQVKLAKNECDWNRVLTKEELIVMVRWYRTLNLYRRDMA